MRAIGIIQLSMAAILAVGCTATTVRSPSDPAASERLPAANPAAANAVHGDVRDEEEWYLDVGDGCELYVREIGHGPMLVVLHGGWGAEHSYLLDAFAGLDRRFRLMFYDQRGSLRSPCPDSTISVLRHVEDLERFRDERGLSEMTLVGHSMGSFLAMSYAERYRDRVAGMVLLGAVMPRLPRSEEEVEIYRSGERAFREFAAAAEQRQVEREGLDRDDLTARERTDRWRIAFASGNLYRVDRWRQMRGGRAFYNSTAGAAAGRSMPGDWDFLPTLESVGGPVVVINGDHDLVGFGGEFHRRILQDLVNVEFVLLERAGHNAWVDQPEAFARALGSALEKILANGRH